MARGTAYKPGDSFTLTDKDTVLYAQWSKNSGSAGTGTNGTAKPTDIPKTGDNSNLTLWFALADCQRWCSNRNSRYQQ